MKIVLEYEKENCWDEGPNTIYKVIEVDGLTRKARRKRRPKKVMEILTQVKGTLFSNGRIKESKDVSVRWF